MPIYSQPVSSRHFLSPYSTLLYSAFPLFCLLLLLQQTAHPSLYSHLTRHPTLHLISSLPYKNPTDTRIAF
ncbi:hypothetical protein BKA65DRAFT_493146 [Rhexocercosporidium sp. MPI-PUGE-AT-0058]|nr:hypothetical protein BKA65DRAFT_493146 [Rhexocercosporidium sp. MPI-PUGE-AT-0058]